MGTGAQLAMLPWFVRDYIAATRHLSLAERGAYTDLLFLSWEMGPLPADTERLARLVGCGADEFAQIWPGIREKFSETAGGLVNARLEEHRAESRRRSQTARQKAEKRWHADIPGLFDNAAADAAADAGAHAAADAAGPHSAYAQTMLPSPSPSPSPKPSPNPETQPVARAAKPKPAYEAMEFHQQIIEVFREGCPLIRGVRTWTATRRRHLNARIRETLVLGKAADTVEYWKAVAHKVETSDFLSGRAPGKRPWRFSLAWLVESEENFNKVLEGAYEDQRRSGGANGSRHGR